MPDVSIPSEPRHAVAGLRSIVVIAIFASLLLLAPARASATASNANAVPSTSSGDGLTPENSAPSCWDIKQRHPASPNGQYYLYLPALGSPEQFYCDMTTDGGGWLLVGRGRENWTFQPNGQRSPFLVRTSPLGFAAATLSSESIDKLLNGVNVSDLPDGVRVRRAANTAGTTWQELRLNMAGLTRWSWGFGGGLRVGSLTINGAPYGTTNTADTVGDWFGIPTSLSGVNDTRRIVTKLWSTFGWRMGFAYGSQVCGATTSSTSYLFDARGNGCYAMPFTQVFVRPKIREADVAYTPIGTSPIPEATLRPLLSSVPELAPSGVRGLAPSKFWANHEVEVWAFAEIGNTVYVGGKFAEVVNGPGGKVVEQAYLAAFDRTTGVHLPSFAPQVEGPVYDLTVTSDGRLIVGGEFLDINGAAHTSGLAVLDPATGAVDSSWISDIHMLNGSRPLVNDLEVLGKWLYVVGDFEELHRINGEPNFRTWRITRLDAVTGEVDWTWRPRADFEVVNVHPTNDRVFFAGKFATINQSPNTSALGTVSTVDGTTIAGLQQQQASTTSGKIYQQAVLRTLDGAGVFVGGSEHDFQLLDPNTHALVNSHITKTGGDFQLITEVDGVIYASCHCNQWNYSSTNTWPNPTGYSRVDKSNYLMAFDRATGTVDTEFHPDFYVGQYYEGPWESHEDATGCLWVGGDLNRGAWNGSGYNWLAGFARLCPRDTVAPSVPASFSATLTSGDVQLAWNPSVDQGGQAVEYEIWRDDRVLRKQSGRYFTDAAVTTNHTYAVRAVDAAGNRSATSAPVAITLPTPPLASLLTNSTTWSYSDIGGATPAGWPLSDTTSWKTGRGEFGWGDGDEDTVIASAPITHHFATTLSLTQGLIDTNGTLRFRVKRDDGISLYLDGTEILRDNLPAGPLAATTPSTSFIFGPAENEWLEVRYPIAIGAGTHTVSAELHQGNAGNTDGTFALTLDVVPGAGGSALPSTPTPSVGTIEDTTATVSWTPSTDDTGLIGQLIALTQTGSNTVRRWYLPASASSYGLYGLTPRTSYTVQVSAVDGDSNTVASGPVTFDTTGAIEHLAFGSRWTYRYESTAAADNWMTAGFDDSTWRSGAGELGFGDGDEVTVIGTSGNRVAYFRSSVTIADPSLVGALTLDVIGDDGVVVFVNGVEAGRNNVPAGPLTNQTYASSPIFGAAESTPVSFTVPASMLVAGTNTIAVAVLQDWLGSPDLSFDLRATESRR